MREVADRLPLTLFVDFEIVCRQIRDEVTLFVEDRNAEMYYVDAAPEDGLRVERRREPGKHQTNEQDAQHRLHL